MKRMFIGFSFLGSSAAHEASNGSTAAPVIDRPSILLVLSNSLFIKRYILFCVEYCEKASKVSDIEALETFVFGHIISVASIVTISSQELMHQGQQHRHREVKISIP